MAILSKSHIWNSPRLDSKIKSRNVSSAEKWVGYLFAPLGPFLFQALVAQYLNVYYTDVMGATKWLGGGFLIMYPIVSKILDAITNVIMGMLIDRTRTRQGKLRPYILMSAPLLTLSGLLLFMVPNWSETGRVIWVMFTYNFYCAVAFTMFFISSNLLVPNASRNSMQRTQLSVFNNIANVAGTGIIVALLIPMLVMPVIGVDKSKWILVMSIFAVLIFPCVILMYFFTRERVTEEDLTAGVQEKVPVGRQLKAMFTDKYWLLIMGFYLIFNLRQLPQHCPAVLLQLGAGHLQRRHYPDAGQRPGRSAYGDRYAGGVAPGQGVRQEEPDRRGAGGVCHRFRYLLLLPPADDHCAYRPVYQEYGVCAYCIYLYVPDRGYTGHSGV